MQIEILSGDDVKAALPMPKAIEAMKHAFGQLSTIKATVPLRSKISSDKGDTLLMPAYLHGNQDLGILWLSSALVCRPRHRCKRLWRFRMPLPLF